MNKQLLNQLKHQASFWCHQNIPEQFDEETMGYGSAWEDKFAELIVEECARIARATPCPYEEDEVRQRLGHTWDMASIEAGRGIVKHFGVEEQVQDSKKLHTCPYREEIHNDYESLCECDEEQQHQCAMDI